jgi:hypothetical protein
VPLKKKKLFTLLSYTSNPVAGTGILFRSAVVIRGTSIPFVVLFTSSMDEGSGVAGVGLILTCPWIRVDMVNRENKNGMNTFMIPVIEISPNRFKDSFCFNTGKNIRR